MEENLNKRYYIYTRVSSKEQNETGDQFKSLRCSNYENYLKRKVLIKKKKKWKN